MRTCTPSSARQSAVRTPGRRVITRYAFEFFQDQVAQLRAISLQAKLQGEDGSMSEMVRQALDAYLAQRKEATPGSPSVRVYARAVVRRLPWRNSET